MTKYTKPVVRETRIEIQGRPLVVELRAAGLHLRLKGQRTGVTVPYEAIRVLGGRMNVAGD